MLRQDEKKTESIESIDRREVRIQIPAGESTEETPLIPKSTVRRQLTEAIKLLSDAHARRSKSIVSSGVSLAFLLAAGGLIADGVRRHYMCGGIVDACLEYATPEFVMGGVSALVSCIAGVTACSATPAELITIDNKLKNTEIEKLNELGQKYNINTHATRLVADVLRDFKKRAAELGITYQEYSAGLFPSAVSAAPATPSILPIYVQPAAGPSRSLT